METKAFDDIARYAAPGRERLVELADFLDEVPADRLTFTRWYGQGKGCAVGLAAATHPWFKAQGLRLEEDASGQVCWPVYGAHSDRAAVAKFFGLTLSDMNSLLDPAGYDGALEPRPKQVAAKIRSFLDVMVPA